MTACNLGGCAEGLCDLSSGLCVDCLQQEDCPNGLVCNDFSGRCVQPIAGCTSDEECQGLRCDAVKGACVECISDGDCGLNAVCDVLSGSCAVQQACVTDGDCSDGVCDPDKRICVECFNPAHCASGVCDTFTSTCVASCVDHDPTEPNDGDEAVTLADGGAHEGAICPGDVDEFLIFAEGTLTAILTLDGGGNIILTLENSSGSVIATGESITQHGLVPGTYRLVVRGVTAEVTGDYLLSVDVEAPSRCEQLDAEPNNTTGTAQSVSANNSLTAASICGADIDVFRFTAATGDDLEVAVSAGEGNGVLALEILNGVGSIVASGNPSALANVSGGTFFARVTASGGDRAYTLRVNATAEPPPCTQADAEPNDEDAQAIPLTPGVAVSGTICAGDVDKHRFAAAALDDVNITITGSGLSAQLVRAADGALIASGLTMSATDLAAGGYRVVVRGATASDESQYTVRVTLTPEPVPDPCTEGGIEPDSRTAPRALALDGTPQAARICTSDTDFFRFTLPFSSTVTVRARFTHANGDLDMRLTDSAGATITSALSITDDEVIVRTLNAGTYGVEVYGFAGAVNTFTMEATLQGCTPEDGFEDNNAFTRPTPIGAAPVTATRCPGDDDFYAIHIASGESLDATLSGSGLSMQLMSSTDGSVLQNDNAGRIQTSALAPGRYVLRVTGAGADRVEYTLTAARSGGGACVDDGAAPNDTSAQAFALDDSGLLDGSYQVGSLVSCELVDVDWFRIALPGQRQVAVQLAFDPTRDVDIEILEPRGTTGLTRSLARSFATNKQDRVSGIINSGGEFFLRAVGFDSVPTTYGIGVEVTSLPNSSCVDDRFDTWTATSNGADTVFKNDTATSAVALSVGEVLPAQKICVGNVDWYKLSAQVGQVILIHIDYVHSTSGDIDMQLFGPSNQSTPVASAGGVDGTEDISFTVTTAGDHFIKVFEFQNDGTNSYDLSLP